MNKVSNFKRRIINFRLLLIRQEKRAEYLRRLNIFKTFGTDIKYGSMSIPAEPYLVKIHNNVRISANVTFVTHDIISGMFEKCPKVNKNSDGSSRQFRFSMGTIEILDHCMIGTGAILLKNIKIGPCAIVAAGSVVTKDVPEGTIVAGNPAKVIGSFYDLASKRANELDKADNKDSIHEIDKDYWS